MQTWVVTLRRLTVISLLSVLPACTGSLTPEPTDDGASIATALGLDQPEAGLFSVASTSDCVAEGEPATEIRRAMLESLNLYRQQNGLRPLSYSNRLEAAISDHVRDLWERDFFDHTNPDGLGPSERALNAGFCHQYVGENIAAGQPTEQAVMVAWQNSPPHNDNLLEPDFAYVGMGYFVDPSGRKYWGQLFAFEYP